MGGGDSQTQEQTQNSTTSPWSNAQGLLNNLLVQYNGMSTDLTDAQRNAIANMRSTLQNQPDYSGMVRSGADRLAGTNYNTQIGQLNDAYSQLQGNLGGLARGDYLDPMSSPGMKNWIDTMSGDITDRVKGVYAASGRDPSGAGSFAGSLSRGLTEGLAPTIASQANTLRNQQMQAANQLFGAGNTTSSGTAALNNLSNNSLLQAMGLYSSLPGLSTQNAQGLLDLANNESGTVWNNLARMLQGGSTLGSMGSSSTGSGTTTRNQGQNLFSNILGGITGASTLLPLLFSDEDLKEDIAEVGSLHDGQPVFSYRYKGDPTPRIGLIAQEVEKVYPEAVVDIGGYKAVDYGKATRFARGILDPWLAEVA